MSCGTGTGLKPRKPCASSLVSCSTAQTVAAVGDVGEERRVGHADADGGGIVDLPPPAL